MRLNLGHNGAFDQGACARAASHCLGVLTGTCTQPTEALSEERGIYAACLAFIGGVDIFKGTFIIKTLEHHRTVSRAQRARVSPPILCYPATF